MTTCYIVTWRFRADKPELAKDHLQLLRQPRAIGLKQHKALVPGNGEYVVVACQRVEVEDPK